VSAECGNNSDDRSTSAYHLVDRRSDEVSTSEASLILTVGVAASRDRDDDRGVASRKRGSDQWSGDPRVNFGIESVSLVSHILNCHSVGDMEISEFVDREVGLLSRCALPWWRETLEATLKLGYFAGSLSRKKPAVDSNVSTRDSLFIKRCYDILDSQLVWNTIGEQ